MIWVVQTSELKRIRKAGIRKLWRNKCVVEIDHSCPFDVIDIIRYYYCTRWCVIVDLEDYETCRCKISLIWYQPNFQHRLIILHHIYNQLSMEINQGFVGNNKPMLYPTPVATTPIRKISVMALSFSILRIVALVIPRLINQMVDIMSTKGHSQVFKGIALSMQQGIIVTNPKKAKEMNVTSPHFNGKYGSLIETNCSSSSIMMFTKALLLVAKSSAKRELSSIENPFFVYMLIIYFFQSSNMFQTSQNSRSSYCLMKAISALAETQSQQAISSAPATMAATQIPKIPTVVIPEETPLRMMMVVLTVPSTPPQMNDLIISPISRCSSTCSYPRSSF